MRARLPALPSRSGHLPFLTFMLLFVFSIAGGTVYTVERLRLEAIGFHTEVTAMQARAFEDQLTQSLNIVDLMLDNLLSADLVKQSPASVGAYFETELRRIPLLRSLSLLDEHGRIVASSNAQNLGRTPALDDFLPPDPGDGLIGSLRFGRPWSGRDFADAYPITDQRAAQPKAPDLIPVTHTQRIAGHTYTVLAALNPDYFVNLFDKALKSKKAAAEVLRYDGIMMLSTDDDLPGVRHEDEALREVLNDKEFGSYEESGDYAVPTLSAFRVSRQFPLVVITHLDRDQAMQAWAAERRHLLWLIIPTLLGVVVLATLVYLRQLRLAQAHALAQSQERLRLAAVLNALPANLVMLDTSASVVMGNAGWSQFLADARVDVPDDGVGLNFPTLCARLNPQDPGLAQRFASGIDGVLRHAVAIMDLEYRMPLPDGDRWFRMVARTLHEPGLTGAVVMQMDITERVTAKQALEEFNRDFESFLNQTTDFIYFKDQDSRFRFCSQTLATITGHAHWRDMIGKHDREVFPADVAAIYEAEERPLFQEGKSLLNRVDPYYDAQGQPGFVQTSKWPLFNAQGDVVGIFGISRDVTEQRRVEARLQLAATVFTHAREGIMITDAQGTIVDVNDTFTRITGYSREDAIGNNPRMLKSGRHGPDHYATMWHGLRRDGYWYGEIWNRRKSGEIIAEMQTVSAVRDAQGQVQHYVALFSDITAMKQHEQQLEHIAHYDVLTQLPNRVLLADRLQQALIQSQRRKRALAVVFLDLDGFKAINDNHGHDAGDALLIAVAQRLKSALREGDTLARIGGDEFVAVLVDLEHSRDCEPVLQRMLQAASDPLVVGGAVLHVSASMGATLYPQDPSDADLLMRHADQAMYTAKHSGKNRYHLFDVAQDAAIQIQRESVERIRLALAQGELVLYYQPKVNMQSFEVVGAEALIRWQHPEHGLLAPAEFLPLIDNTELSITVGEWVIDTALTQLAAWQQVGLAFPVSVNLGAHQLQQVGFVARLQALLAAHPDVPARRLELKLLESSALEDIHQVSDVMHACRALGVRFALDDFGTGYSSLTYLKRLPADVLKIDQSFVLDMLSDPDDRAIVEGVIGLASAFHREVIAEGVETAAHGALLQTLGCQLAQGFGIAHPMPADAFEPWTAQWAAKPAWTA